MPSTTMLIGRRRDRGVILIHDGNGRLQVWAEKVALGRPYRRRVSVWVGYEADEKPTPDDTQEFESARRFLFVES